MFIVLYLVLSLLWNNGICQETTNTTEDNSTDLKYPPYYDYILKLSFELDEDLVPPYIIKLIYNESSPYLITTDDVLNLFNLKYITLNQSQELLNKLNISSSKILSLDGFDVFLKEFNVTFPDFYNRVLLNRLGISGSPARDFLVALNIDAAEFSNGMTFGQPDPYEEFKKGNFSEESLEAALTTVGRTPAALFEACKDEIVLRINSTSRPTIAQILKKYNFGEKSAMDLWNASSLTIENVRQIPSFVGIINNSTAKLNSTSVLGLLIGRFEAAVNSLVYDLWKEESIFKVFGDTPSNKSKVQVRDVVNSIPWKNIVRLSLINMNISTDSIEYAETNLAFEANLLDCVFVTLVNGEVVSENITEVHIDEEHVYINVTSEISEIILGSPLICQGKVCGLAKSVNGSTVLLDSFYIQPIGPSGTAEPSSSNIIYKIVLILIVSYIFWMD